MRKRQEQMSSRSGSTQQTEVEEDEVLEDNQAPAFGAVDDVATDREVKGAAVAGALVGVTMELCATSIVLTPPGALLLGAAGAAYIAKKDEGGLGQVARIGGEKIANAAERLREKTDHMRDESTTFDQAATNVERVVQTVGTSTKRAAQKLGQSTQWMIDRASSSLSSVDEKKEHQEEVMIEENLSEKKNSLQMREESFSATSNQASSSCSSMERVVQNVGTSTIRAARTVSQSTKWMIRRASSLSANQKEENHQVEENQEHIPEQDGEKETEEEAEKETEKRQKKR